MAELDLLVTPRASANRVGPWREGVLRVRVTRPPAGGEANAAVLRLVARSLGLPVSRLALRSGATGRRKRLHVDGLDTGELERRLSTLVAD